MRDLREACGDGEADRPTTNDEVGEVIFAGGKGKVRGGGCGVSAGET